MCMYIYTLYNIGGYVPIILHSIEIFIEDAYVIGVIIYRKIF